MDNSTKVDGLVSCEETFAEALVDHMLRVDAGISDETELNHYVYIDSTLAHGLGHGSRPCMQEPPRIVEPNSMAHVDTWWTALHHVGIAATDLYCLRVFGRQFDDIPNVDKKGVLRVLDSIKLLFQDGSDAGVFNAVVARRL